MAMSYSPIYSKNNVIVIDRTRSVDPINHVLALSIQNQGTSKVYYKLAESSGSWSIALPSDGKLGSVDSGTTGYFNVTLQRALPASDIIETIDFTLEAYSDSGYSNLIDSVDFSITVIIADIHNWPNYTKYDFDDGTTQGWTLGGYMSISNAKSIGAGGYAVYIKETSGFGKVTSMTKSVTVPNNNRAVMVFYINYHNTDFGVNYVAVKVNGNTIYRAGASGNAILYPIGSNATRWDIIGVDLSDYAGQSVTIDIEIGIGGFGECFIDEIIFAGTNAL